MSEQPIRGACLCGAVTYDIAGEPLFTAICHCTHCQRQTSSSFSIVIGVPPDSFRPRGDIKTFRDRGDSGKAVERRFCPQCGSAIVSVAEAVPGVVFVKAGTLEHPERFTPAMEIFCEHAMPWLAPACANRFPGAPPHA